MDMDHMDSTAMGSTPYSNQTYAKIYWYLMAVCILAIGLVSWSFRLISYLRMRAASIDKAGSSTTNFTYTIVSIFREASYSQLHIPYFGILPSTGNLLICGSYLVILLSCLLSRVWSTIPIFWEAIALRAAYLCVAQLALLIALSTKKNLIAAITHSSHERIILFHRLVGICVLMTATLHMGYFLREWLYYDVWKSQWAQMGMSMLRWGFAAWGLLIFILFTSLGFIRQRLYESWIIVHIASMIAFFAMLILHLDPPYRPWAYAPMIIWAIDRLMRFSSRAYLHVDLKNMKFRGEASIEILPGGITKVTVPNFRMTRRAGQFAYVSVYKLGINSHPFTIVSPPDSADVVFMMKAKQGLTRLLHKQAASQLPPNNRGVMCAIEGPYGGSHSALQGFDSVVLIAGGIGSTFTHSLFLDLVRNPGCCRRVNYIWAMKSSKEAQWFEDEMSFYQRTAIDAGIKLKVDLWVTCDTEYTSTDNEIVKPCVACTCRREEDSRSTPQQLDRAPHSEYGHEKSFQTMTIEELNTTDLIGHKPCCCMQKDTSDAVSEYCHFSSGRPDLYSSLTRFVDPALGETGIAVCGPKALCRDVRNIVTRISDERAVKKGTGAEAIYLHVENQEY